MTQHTRPARAAAPLRVGWQRHADTGESGAVLEWGTNREYVGADELRRVGLMLLSASVAVHVGEQVYWSLLRRGITEETAADVVWQSIGAWTWQRKPTA